MSIVENIFRHFSPGIKRNDIRSPEQIATEQRRVHDERIANIKEANRHKLLVADAGTTDEIVPGEEFYDWEDEALKGMLARNVTYQQGVYDLADLCDKQEKEFEELYGNIRMLPDPDHK